MEKLTNDHRIVYVLLRVEGWEVLPKLLCQEFHSFLVSGKGLGRIDTTDATGYNVTVSFLHPLEEQETVLPISDR